MDIVRQCQIPLPLVGPLAAFALVAMGCGAGTGTNGGAANLPSAGSHPFTEVEEVLIGEKGQDYRSPSVAIVGEELWMWVQRQSTSDPTDQAIELHSSSDGLHWTLQHENVFQVPSSEWEKGFLSSPSVTGKPGAFTLWYIGGDDRSGVGMATSEDGINWKRREPSPIFPDTFPTAAGPPLLSPTGIRESEGWAVWFLADDGAGLHTGHVPDTGIGTLGEDYPLFEGSGSSETDLLWEKDAITSIRIQLENSPTGRGLYRMWYGGSRIAASGLQDGGIGFAGSEDGSQWERSPLGPSLYNPGFGEKDPTTIQWQDESLLYYARFWKKEGDNRHVIRLSLFGDETHRDEWLEEK